jgi:hypothetical protein
LRVDTPSPDRIEPFWQLGFAVLLLVTTAGSLLLRGKASDK